MNAPLCRHIRHADHPHLRQNKTNGTQSYNALRRQIIRLMMQVQVQHNAPHIYAEHLQNIGTLSVQITLGTPSNPQTRATLREDGRVVSVSHDEHETSLRLPVQVPIHGSDLSLQMPTTSSTDVDFRLRLRAGEDGPTESYGFRSSSDEVPWSASQLKSETAIHCKACHLVFIPRERIFRWKNLPSEGWAEMMEFWHCHKPHEHASSDSGKLTTESRLALSEGVGMVAPMELLVSSADCTGVKRTNPDEASSSLQCSSCESFVGSTDDESDGFRLRKAYLCIVQGPSGHMTSYPLENWLSGLLLSAIETQGVRKFFVHEAGLEMSVGRDIWVFATDVNISSTNSPVGEPVHMIKVLHHSHFQNDDAHGLLDSKTYSKGEIELPRSEIDALFTLLDESIALIPPRKQARHLGEWQIGFLRRFQSHALHV